LQDVYLYTLDDLQRLIQKNQACRKAAALKAEVLIEDKVQHYLDLLKVKSVAPIICTYRRQAEDWRDEEIKKALNLLEQGMEQEEVIKRLAYRLTNKLIHTPSITLSSAAKLNQKDVLSSI
jgi:glutamyl-tRNA reductase